MDFLKKAIEIFELNEELHKKDLKDVCGWLNVKTTEDLVLEKKYISINILRSQIDEMESTYEEFPRDRNRSLKILKELKSGKNPEPLYIEKDDKTSFVMEGRHRMVAFKWYGLEDFPIILVSKKNKHKITNKV
jgi:hypothetical protein